MPNSNGERNTAQPPKEPPNGAAAAFTLEDLETPPAPSGAMDFALEDLRLPLNYQEGLGVKRQLLSITVRRPDRQWWVRVHPDPAYRIDTGIVEVQETREAYLVSPALRDELGGDVVYKTVALAMNRQGLPFLWTVRLPGADGRLDPWNEVAREAMALAMHQWIRITSNGSGYDVYTTTKELAEPSWPDLTFEQVLHVGFRGKYLADANHSVLRRLRGEE